MVGVSPSGPDFPDGEDKAIQEYLDKQSTKELLIAISTALNIQYITRELFKWEKGLHNPSKQ
ncbi:MAG: hypothetical protein QXU09_02315 [Thermoproteota archaeon]